MPKALHIQSHLTNSIISGLTVLNFTVLPQPVRSDHHTVSVCPDSGTVTALSANSFCAGTPSKYEITIYELALCTANPIQGSTGSKSLVTSNCVTTMSSSTGVTVNLGGSATVSLPKAASRPSKGTYTYSYVILKNTFGLQGTYELQGGNTYYSTKDGDTKTNAPAEDYVEDLTDFGDSSWDPEWGPYDHPTGGKISAMLLNDNNQRASSEGGVTRLIGVFETNSGKPVVITKATNGVDVKFSVKNSAMGIDADESGFPNQFGSGPFKPSFAPF